MGANGNKLELAGKRFGRLTVIKECGRRYGRVEWLCKCDCGNFTKATASHLKSGAVTSCGCYRHEAVSTHEMSRTRLYRIWCLIIDRCENPNGSNGKRYKDRGIRMCREWRNSFEVFRDWALANGYQDDLTIDRIDNNGNYEPSNCRWATAKEQSRNRRSNVMLTCDGETHCMVEWAEMTNQPRGRLANRYRRGWSDREIIYGRA